ncbi:MAG: GNAT family N-acetyltransferase [Silicimonas sp.]|nr:GNAT family N-acetyltransferase [Silicimonas sp.]
MRPDPASIFFRDLEIGDTGWLVQRHAELYARDEGFDITFEAMVAEILANYIRTRDPARERAFIAVEGDRRLGSIFCTRTEERRFAKLRMFLLEPEARGIGLGQRLLDACIGYARAVGYSRMKLWTHESHRAACALYAKNGFVCAGSEATHSFGVDVVEQTWELDLI